MGIADKIYRVYNNIHILFKDNPKNAAKNKFIVNAPLIELLIVIANPFKILVYTKDYQNYLNYNYLVAKEVSC